MEHRSGPRIGHVGYGEVGTILAQALKPQALAWVGTWDVLLPDPVQGPAMAARARAAGVETCASADALYREANLVISAVTASNTYAAAEDAARSIRAGTFYFDLSSASPDTKARAAKLVEAAGAHYVEAGVMTSVPPYGIRVPMVVGGKRAVELARLLEPFGFALEVVSEDVGVASAIKMCRSVIVKGMEALVIESFTTARRHGVEARVLESLKETFPGLDWEKQGAYFFQRVIKHGKRRAEEMREAAVTVREAGFDPLMAAATAQKQAQVATLAAKGTFARIGADAGWRDYADRVIQDLENRKKTA
jgi:3-hydroxyisobutyrate dehydrogenase-like beta-hydroxyacid dehydrogenase